MKTYADITKPALAALTFGLGVTNLAAETPNPATLEESHKIVIAHRGASGFLPEHTLPTYAMAYALGADFIEPDVVMTKDKALIAMHDIHLEQTTNVEDVFPARARSDGRWYAADFTLEEIKRLHVHERLNRDGVAAFPERFRSDSKGFQVPSLIEVVELVLELNRITGCTVGLYPETKDPAFHDEEGLPLEQELLRVLADYGYSGPDAPVFIQSFDPRNLKEMRFQLGTKLPLIQLISGSPKQDFLITPAGLNDIATYANGIGPSKRRIEDDNGNSIANNALVRMAHMRGLLVHPYTFRADQVPLGYASFESELRRFYEEYGVDGLFTDQPNFAAQVAKPDKKDAANNTVGQRCAL